VLLKFAYRWLWPAPAIVGWVIILPDFPTDGLSCLDARLQPSLVGRVYCMRRVLMSPSKELASFWNSYYRPSLESLLEEKELNGAVVWPGLTLNCSQKGKGWRFETSRLQAHRKGKRSRIVGSATRVGAGYGCYLWTKLAP